MTIKFCMLCNQKYEYYFSNVSVQLGSFLLFCGYLCDMCIKKLGILFHVISHQHIYKLIIQMELHEMCLPFCGVRLVRSFLFYVMFCRSLFVLLSLSCWPFYCPFWPLSVFFDLRLLFTLLVSSNFSY